MESWLKNIKSDKRALLMALVNLAVVLLFFSARYFNIHCSKTVRILYDVVWTPLISLLFLVPMMSMFLWRRENYAKTSPYLIIAAFSSLTILLMLCL